MYSRRLNPALLAFRVVIVQLTLGDHSRGDLFQISMFRRAIIRVERLFVEEGGTLFLGSRLT